METIRKNSKKRQAIMDVLRCTTEHPTAESVFNALKGEYPQLSLATVYRNLNMLQSDGAITSVGTVNGQERFDARLDEHAHFVCRRCFSVYDIELQDDLVYNYEKAMMDKGFCLEERNVRFSGLCPKCVKADK